MARRNPVEISTDRFRRLAQRVTDLAAEYLQNIDQQRISPDTTGAETLRRLQGVTVKVAELVAVPPVVVTAIFPVIAPVGTVAVT